MEIVNIAVDFFVNLDEHVATFVSAYGAASYGLLFGIIFAETGLVFAPFLPGDSLLFVSGALAAGGSLNLGVLLALLSIAAVLGDTLNYFIGRTMYQKLLLNSRVRINQNHIEKTKLFFEKHGGKTIILARFIPVIRTFAPFVAGAGSMDYARFLAYNVIGGILWVFVFVPAGYFFGNLEIVKENFSLFVAIIVAVSLLPVVLNVVKSIRER